VADILREHGPAWREANRGHVSLDQLKVMSAIERCRTAALGGHVARCENAACGHTMIAYNSCRNRHCPKCQAAASRRWLADREAELLPVPYFHVVYTLPSKLRDIAYQNKRTARRRPACRRPSTAAGCHTGRAARAALPMPALRRPHDRHRGLRARMRAKVAADPKHDRHIMSQTACQRRRFPVPLRWLHAGGDLSRRNPVNQRADRPLIRSTPPSRSLLRASRPRSTPLSRSPRATFAPTIITSATIKSP